MNTKEIFYFLILFFSFPVFSETLPVKITIPQVYFSPNNDGILDTMDFSFYPQKDLVISNWEFSITDESGKLIRNYQADLRFKNKSNIGGIFSSKEKLVNREIKLPSLISWNGYASNGKIPPDGRYIYKLKITLSNGTEWKSVDRTIYLDAHTPLVKTLSENRTFNPYTEKSKENLMIQQEVIGENSDRWKGTIFNSDGLAIKTYLWEHSKVPKIFTWDGKDDRGILQDPGFYKYEIQGEDFSENKEKKEIAFLELQRLSQTIGVQALSDSFSPNGDSWEDTLSFRLFAANPKTIKSWKLTICKIECKDGKFVKYFSGEDQLPNYIEWDGLDSNGKNAGSGIFIYQLEVSTNLETLKTVPKSFQIDLNPIQLKFKINTNGFTPDDDGEDDVLDIFPSIKNANIQFWKLSLVEKFGKENPPKRRVIKKWRGYGKPANKISWDGLTDEGRLIGSLAELEMHFSFRNEKGEVKTYIVQEFSTGILVLPKDKYNLKISIPEYILQKEEDKVLSLIQKNLKSYPGYKVELQSHSKQLGDNKENMRRTEKRSKEIFQKLFGQVATNDRYSYRGFGEIDLLFQEEIPYYQEKNDRIDLILSLPETKK
jgi:flagellar hook assembly protein FlgD